MPLLSGRGARLDREAKTVVTLHPSANAVRPETGGLWQSPPTVELDAHLDDRQKVLWCNFTFHGRPCFTTQLLNDIGAVQNAVVELFKEGAEPAPIKYLVWASQMPGVWNLGGDLGFFARMIRTRNRGELLRYAHAVVEEGYRNAIHLDLPLITVSLVQGDALGGGFEAALSSNLIVAERSAKFGLPEILFNLFPGMGAYSFLARRIAPALAERLIFSGRIYTAEALYEMGVVDVLAPDGGGVGALQDYVQRNSDRHNAHRAIYAARQRYAPVSRDEMLDIATSWVDTALTLTEKDLRKMERLAAAQDRRRARLTESGLLKGETA